MLRNFDNCRLISIIALDFTKAFDIINHLLLDKLKLCGLSQLALSLICSFLTNRTQQILVYNPFPLFSFTRAVFSGVHQGSILRPLLFIISVSNLSNFSLSSELFMYAFTNNALHLNSSKLSLLIVDSSTLLSRIQFFDIALNSFQFLAPPLLRFSVSIQVLGCLCSFTSSLSLLPYLFLLSKTLHLSITCYISI